MFVNLFDLYLIMVIILKINKRSVINIHNTEEKVNKSIKPKVNRFISSISCRALTLMNSLLLPLCIAFIYAGIGFCKSAMVDIIFAQSVYWPIFEHLLVSLVLIVCGGALLDVTLRELDAN